MHVHEVASLPGETGLPMSWSQERVSPFLAKFDLSAYFATDRDAADAVSGVPLASVLHATTPRTQFVCFTDEVPRRSLLNGGIKLGYKSHTKGRAYASETGTAFPRPRLKGCQQRQSRGLHQGRFADSNACSERQNLRVPSGSLRFMGSVSSTIAATKWLGRTSSRQLVVQLSNSPQQPESGQTAVGTR